MVLTRKNVGIAEENHNQDDEGEDERTMRVREFQIHRRLGQEQSKYNTHRLPWEQENGHPPNKGRNQRKKPLPKQEGQ